MVEEGEEKRGAPADKKGPETPRRWAESLGTLGSSVEKNRRFRIGRRGTIEIRAYACWRSLLMERGVPWT